jgi:hypothetical protein
VPNISYISPQSSTIKELTRAILSKNGAAELADYIFVSSSSRSNRLLEQELLLEVEKKGLWSTFQAPRYATLGSLPHQILNIEAEQLAPAAACQLAWVNSLSKCSPSQVLLHLGVDIKSRTETLLLAQQLANFFSQLAAEQISCQQLAMDSALSEGEQQKFALLAQIHVDYLYFLNSADLQDKDHARQASLDSGDLSLDSSTKIVVLCVPEMSSFQRKLLELCGSQVEFIQLEFEHLANAYDDFACVDCDVFTEAGNTLLHNSKLSFAANPQNMVECALQSLSSNGAKHSPEDVTFSLLEKQCAPFLSQTLGDFDVDVRTAVGGDLESSLPVLLLKQLQTYLDNPSFENGAALLVHPDLLPNPKLKAELDSYRQDNYPQRLPEIYLAQLPAVVNEQTNGLNEAAAATRNFLLGVYGQININSEQNEESHRRAKGLEMIAATLNEVQHLSDSLSNNPKLRFNFARSLDFILHQCRGKKLAQRYNEQSVECLDWLELSLDPAPEMVILGFNENYVPGQAVNNMFVDNELAQQLGMYSDKQRLARDSYILQSLAVVRKNAGGHLHLICGRTQNDGSPLLPSRLLFMCSDHDAYANAAEFSSEPLPPSASPNRPASERLLPRNDNDKIPQRVSVTAINNYLKSPYSFYLSHHLRLNSVEINCDELNPMVYGIFAHSVLQNFGNSEARNSVDAGEIANYLRSECRRLFEQRFVSPSPVIHAQVELLNTRFSDFAEKQAARAADGWKIISNERRLPSGCRLFDSKFDISGVIDRIDQRGDEICLIDYKTPNGKSRYTQKALFKNNLFTDLQLPLYYFLSDTFSDINSNKISLAYALLTADSKDCGFTSLKFDDEHKQIAERQCRQVFNEIESKIWFDLGDSPFATEAEQALRGDSLLGVITLCDGE